jgi:hypothetical protein
MLIDEYLPSGEATEVQEVHVKAATMSPGGRSGKPIFRDPMIDALFTIRELPDRLARRWRGEAPRSDPQTVTFKDLETSEMGWVLLAEEQGVELLVGAVGRFWRRDYGWLPVAPEQFTTFDDPGFAKLAVIFRCMWRGRGRPFCDTRRAPPPRTARHARDSAAIGASSTRESRS